VDGLGRFEKEDSKPLYACPVDLFPRNETPYPHTRRWEGLDSGVPVTIS
jgi:hypothetical protein